MVRAGVRTEGERGSNERERDDARRSAGTKVAREEGGEIEQKNSFIWRIKEFGEYRNLENRKVPRRKWRAHGSGAASEWEHAEGASPKARVPVG